MNSRVVTDSLRAVGNNDANLSYISLWACSDLLRLFRVSPLTQLRHRVHSGPPRLRCLTVRVRTLGLIWCLFTTILIGLLGTT